MAYKYYQPNKKDVKDDCGDCVIRALSKVTGNDWGTIFMNLVPIALEMQRMPNERECFERYINENGFKWQSLGKIVGKRRPTVAEFARKHKQGKYIVRVAHHVVAVVDGNYYDTWDSGDRPMYGYWEA